MLLSVVWSLAHIPPTLLAMLTDAKHLAKRPGSMRSHTGHMCQRAATTAQCGTAKRKLSAPARASRHAHSEVTQTLGKCRVMVHRGCV